MPTPLPLDAPAAELAQHWAQPKPMRRGSLGERFVKCSKPGCACGADPEARHGPYSCLTRAVAGKTRSRFLSSEQAEMVRRQIDAGQQFRRQVDAYWKICEQWADQELDDSQTAAATAEAVKKGGSKRASRRKSPRKSAR